MRDINTEKIGWWIFTFGSGQPNAGTYIKIRGTFESARKVMEERYGNRWGFQYSEEEWEDWINRKPWYIPAEVMLEEIDMEG